ncbi:BCCT family transporter [Vibrio chagasii]|nr:BCCT family transporter [Vibrio chagasii]
MVFFITSSDSGSLVIDSITSGDKSGLTCSLNVFFGR